MNTPQRKAKLWLYLKRGLITSPKHRAAMGTNIWLYLHMIDRADWETGAIEDWKDEAEADVLTMPLPTVRYQRRKLAEAGYISCVQGRGRLRVTITKWINPKLPRWITPPSPAAETSEGEPLSGNEAEHGLGPHPPLTGDNNGDNNGANGLSPLKINGYNNGDNNGDNNGIAGVITSTSNPITNNQLPLTSVPAARAADSDQRVKPFVTAFEQHIGYKLKNWGEESKAAKWLLQQGYTPAQAFDCYDHLKADRFTEGKHVGLAWIAKQIGAWLSDAKNPKAKTAPPVRPGKQTSADYERRWAEHAAKRAAAKDKT